MSEIRLLGIKHLHVKAPAIGGTDRLSSIVFDWSPVKPAPRLFEFSVPMTTGHASLIRGQKCSSVRTVQSCRVAAPVTSAHSFGFSGLIRGNRRRCGNKQAADEGGVCLLAPHCSRYEAKVPPNCSQTTVSTNSLVPCFIRFPWPLGNLYRYTPLWTVVRTLYRVQARQC